MHSGFDSNDTLFSGGQEKQHISDVVRRLKGNARSSGLIGFSSTLKEGSWCSGFYQQNSLWLCPDQEETLRRVWTTLRSVTSPILFWSASTTPRWGLVLQSVCTIRVSSECTLRSNYLLRKLEGPHLPRHDVERWLLHVWTVQRLM